MMRIEKEGGKKKKGYMMEERKIKR